MPITPHVSPVEILLVEDKPVDVRMTKEALKDYAVANHLHVTTDGEAALDFIYQRGEYADAPRPDLVLLDLNLPKKDGREILDEVKADDNLRAIPIVVLTSSDIEEDIVGSYYRHANAFVTKPIELDDFVAMVKTIADF